MKGLPNEGNTCYFNSALQCLLQVPQLSNYMILGTFQGDCKFIKEFQKLVKSFWITKTTSINVYELYKIFIERFPQFDNNDQNDCQEVFICMLELLENSCKDFITKIFYSTMVQQTICKSEKSFKKEKTNIHILFPQTKTTISELIKHNQDWNTLDNYEDSKGVIHYVSSTRTIIKTPAPILVFSLRMYEKKIKIQLEQTIQIGDFTYELFSTATHLGSIRGGHYIAYTKHKGQWFIKDDESSNPIEKISMEDYHYLVLYKRLS
jgi:ubiquitin C-terminal hydrolase